MLMSLLSEATGKSWTLRPNRPYIIGSDSDCDIFILGQGLVGRHLQLSFDSMRNQWRFMQLSPAGNILVNGVSVQEQSITHTIRMGVGQDVLVASPEGQSPAARPVDTLITTTTHQAPIEGRTPAHIQPVAQGVQGVRGNEPDPMSVTLNFRPVVDATSKAGLAWKTMSTTDRLLSGILLLSTVNTLIMLSAVPLIISTSSLMSKIEDFSNRLEPMIDQIEQQMNQFNQFFP